MAVLETHPIGRTPVLAEYLDDLRRPVMLIDEPTVDEKPVAHGRLHGNVASLALEKACTDTPQHTGCLLIADVHERFAVGPRVPNCRYSVGWGERRRGGRGHVVAVGRHLVGLCGRSPHAGTATTSPSPGPRPLWDEAEAAYRWWGDQDCPAITRFGVIVDGHGQRSWLDQP